jgi:hypothetical protein
MSIYEFGFFSPAVRLTSCESFPSGLARDAKRSPYYCPTHSACPKDIDDLLKLVTLALDRFLYWFKALQQTFRWRLIS